MHDGGLNHHKAAADRGVLGAVFARLNADDHNYIAVSHGAMGEK